MVRGAAGRPGGTRTVYLRFGTRAALFRRVIDVAVGGDALAAAEIYLLVTRMTGWDLDVYERGLARTLSQLMASPAP